MPDSSTKEAQIISQTLKFDENGDEFCQKEYLWPDGTRSIGINYTGKRRSDYDVEETTGISNSSSSVKEEFYRLNYNTREVDRVVIANLRTAASVQINYCAQQEIGGFSRYGECPILDYFFMLEDKIKYLESILTPEAEEKHELIDYLRRKDQISRIDFSAMQGRFQALHEEKERCIKTCVELEGENTKLIKENDRLKARLEVAEASSPRFAVSGGRAMADF